VTGKVHDIAIVGGGIAGCAAALSLAGSGQSVVMLAPPDDGADRFGEFLSPAANVLLRDLGVAETFASGPHRPANASFSAWGSDLLAERNAIVHVDGPGHVLDRPLFDRMLRRTVEQRGIAIVPCAVESAMQDGDGWHLADITARFVLDCSGRAAVVARHAAVRRREDRLIAAGAFLRQGDDTVEPTPATLIEAVPEGWWYASLLPDKRLSIALFGDSDILPRGLAQDLAAWRDRLGSTRHISRWLASAGFDGDTLPRLAAAGTTWIEPATGPTWAAAGDAAAAFDPLSSHGLATALWSGRKAALAAAAMLEGDTGPLTHYAAILRDAMQGFLTQRQAIYAREQRWPMLPFWKRRANPGSGP
jgi:flavin-dependent dehydrogenase